MNTATDLQLHIIGGFLGSGKTTAIISAAKYLSKKGMKVGVITNDQGKHLVDTTILQAQELPAMEVTGGCFCCHFDDLNDRLKGLVGEYHPDVIFAESVGSCADVVATVVRPLLEMELGAVKPSSYTVFADVRLLRRYLLGLEMPFSEGINYIFGKQIEEAGLLVINKIDLVDQDVINDVDLLVKEKYQHIYTLPVCALDDQHIALWIDAIQNGKYPPPTRSLEMDYDRYAKAESEMAWVDRKYQISTEAGEMPALIYSLVNGLKNLILENHWFDGHIKLAFSDSSQTIKISLANSGGLVTHGTLMESLKEKFCTAKEVTFLLNILVTGNEKILVEKINQLFQEVISTINGSLVIKDAFERKPGYPKPTYRLAD